jgi:hypothetical protein
VEEEKEKQLSTRLGDFVDGKPLGEIEDPELNEAAEAAAAILGVFGETHDLNPVFSDTLRARLVRETRMKAQTAPANAPAAGRRINAPRARRWYSYAAAAVIFLFFLPSLFVARDINNRYKQYLVKKYDKMYVPYSRQLSKNDYLGKNLKPFSESNSFKASKMNFKLHKAREDEYFFKNYRLKSEGGGK